MALPLLLAHAPQTPSSLLPSLTLRRCRHLDAHGILTVVVILVVVAVGYKIWRQRQVNRRAMLSDPQQVLIYEHLKEREAAEKAEKKKNGGPWWAFKRSSPR
ncbi:hypothetical protein N7462_006053 [Penicillium macrosclerotiorum]|uniref:uncharacterized protein n=1 Tax=Penicillium macrosclerotiorum TaxID=303699 RepID=UPI002546C97E|nr:uncharacterized protein N7462_006053 [Penicillium macrosclerotiorum]KAJ5682888.1 hypothetical protein N7462_006053 [Penicillium macrosclerotiorum]